MDHAPIFIVGSASSGTTLLGVMLDRHSQIACGPELSVFNRIQVYRDYNIVRDRIGSWLDSGLLSDGEIDTEVFFFNRNAYFTDKEKIVSYAKQSSHLREFFDVFFKNYLIKRGKKRWAEKTGSNAYYFKHILEIYPKAHIIHLSRDGRDVVCSLTRRGDPPYHSVSHWLYNNAAAIAWCEHPNYMKVKYETMVAEPRETLERVCNHIGVAFEQQMIDASENNYWQEFAEGNIHTSWKATPFSAKISTSSVGRHKTDLSSEMEALFWRTKLSPIGRRKLVTDCKGIADLMARLGYKVPSELGRVPLELCLDGIHTYIRRFRRNLKRNHSVWLPLTYVDMIKRRIEV